MKVDADSFEAENWPSRKPPKVTLAQKRVERRLETAAGRTVEQVLRRGLPAGAGAVALSGAYLAAAGTIAYLATSQILKGIAEGVTPANLVAQARSMAASAFQRKLGRYPTREEYRDLRRRVGNAVLDHFTTIGAGSIPAMWRNFVALFKGE